MQGRRHKVDLGNGEVLPVRVYHADLGGTPAGFAARMDEFRAAALADCLGAASAPFVISTEPSGKPGLAGRRTPFNQSHCGSHAVIAIAEDLSDCRLGVDVELASDEARLGSLLAGFRRRGAVREGDISAAREWTVREAVAKAAGSGVGAAVIRVSVAVQAGAITAASEFGPGGREEWTIHCVDPAPGIVATLAAGLPHKAPAGHRGTQNG